MKENFHYGLLSGYYDAYYLKAQKVRNLIKIDFDNAYKDVDIILTPTTPTPAFKFGENTDDPIAYVPVSEMLEIEGFDEDLVNELRSRAKDALLISAIAMEEKIDSAEPATDLLEMEGMDADLANELASQGIITMDNLAEQSVDDLLGFKGMNEERAAKLIMKAREPWFA